MHSCFPKVDAVRFLEQYFVRSNLAKCCANRTLIRQLKFFSLKVVQSLKDSARNVKRALSENAQLLATLDKEIDFLIDKHRPNSRVLIDQRCLRCFVEFGKYRFYPLYFVDSFIQRRILFIINYHKFEI